MFLRFCRTHYLDNAYLLNRDTRVKILYKFYGKGQYTEFKQGLILKVKNYHFADPGHFKQEKDRKTFKQLQKEINDRVEKEWKEKGFQKIKH